MIYGIYVPKWMHTTHGATLGPPTPITYPTHMVEATILPHTANDSPTLRIPSTWQFVIYVIHVTYDAQYDIYVRQWVHMNHGDT